MFTEFEFGCISQLTIGKRAWTVWLPRLRKSGCDWAAIRIPEGYLRRQRWRSAPWNYN